MDWLAAHPERRMDPRVLWPGVRSIIMLGVNYGPDENPLALLAKRTRGAISAYAQGDDYHDVIKKRLKALARWLVATSGEEVKVFVDTAAVMEKPLAQAAGLGWQGKHTNLVSREFGSWLFLGAIFTAADLPRDEADRDHCGSCNACQEICPTAAFPAPYKLDARRCISYLTIENKGPIPHEFRKSIGNRIYGCDDCLAVCPWNKFAQEGREAKLSARAELRAPSLSDLARLDDAAFRALFTKSPVKRIGRDRFIRNVLIAIGNTEDPSLAVRPNDCWMMQARWCAVRRYGRCRNWWRGRRSGRWRRRRLARADEACVRSDRLAAVHARRDKGRSDCIGRSALDFVADEQFRMVPGHDKNSPSSAVARRHLHAQSGLERSMGPELDAWSRRHRSARPRDRGASRLRRIRPGKADGRHVPVTEHPTPMEVTTKLVRDGMRIKVVEAEFLPAAPAWRAPHASYCVKTENAPGNVWSPSNWDAPLPDDDPEPDRPPARHERQMDDAADRGAMGSLGPRRLWMSEVRELVEGVPMSPFVHVATGADFASPFANAGDQGLGYINSDVTLYLHRLPVTRWVGFDVVNHHATDGIAIGECWLYDEKGPIGTSTVAALAQRKPMAKLPPP